MIIINASEVSAFIGKNPYKKQDEAIQDVINRSKGACSVSEQKAMEICKASVSARRLHKEMVDRSEITQSTAEVETSKLEYTNKVEQLKEEEVKKISDGASRDCKQLEKNFGKLIAAVNTKAEKEILERDLNKQIETARAKATTAKNSVVADMEYMKEVGTRQTNTQFGIRHETDVAKLFEDHTGETIFKDNKCKYLEVVPGVKIAGRFDGFLEDGTLVEIKNRMKRIFGHVPEYESVQIHVYMLMARVEKALLVERHKEKIYVHNVELDEDFADEIMETVREICNTIQ